jgi:predicted acylesterase/phospholipase RssA
MSGADAVFSFNHIFKQEISVINERRPAHARIVLESDKEAHGKEKTDSTGDPIIVPKEDSNLTGLALSGGGVRSAAFCLGALQALNEAEVLSRVDYLSTVSGGGYIGCSLSAALESGRGEFPFETRILEDETPSVQHLRDYSNYLFPNGAKDWLDNTAIYVRGLVANLVLLMPFLLGAAALTLLLHPTRESLSEVGLNRFGLGIPHLFGVTHFVVTLYLAAILLVLGIGWGLLRSIHQNRCEVPSGTTTFVGTAALVVIGSAFCELQPFILDAMFGTAADSFIGSLAKWISNWIDTIAAWLAPVAAVIAFFGRKLGEFVKSATESTKTRAQVARYAAKSAIYLAASVVPLILWAVYLNFSYWGICINEPLLIPPNQPSLKGCPPAWLHNHLGQLLQVKYPATWFYVLAAAAFFVLTLFLRPNANSLHPLYRDRLGKAFLFQPRATLEEDQELAPLRMRLTQLSGRYGPYQLINTALNIQGSKVANRRGRNADFFLLSQNFIGSECTGYVATKQIENIDAGFDLAAAMAMSGAAASSNMGAETIKPLTPTLAILNIRLGYWLRNPKRFVRPERNRGTRNVLANYYILAELLGKLSEERKSVYLTDGGHIENLGIYELLKRHCRVIIAVDAEADRELAFGSFNTLVRYARIDLGIEIDLPWQQITDKGLSTGAAIDVKADAPKSNGPHCAIGQITYSNGHHGVIVYIKSSLTGDENDYVFHYKRRYSAFPHETTVDQMFSEEQFEAYRALGYHATFGLFDRRDDFAKLDPAEFPDARKQLELLDRLFPRKTTGGAPNQRQRFVERFPASA